MTESAVLYAEPQFAAILTEPADDLAVWASRAVTHLTTEGALALSMDAPEIWLQKALGVEDVDPAPLSDKVEALSRYVSALSFQGQVENLIDVEYQARGLGAPRKVWCKSPLAAAYTAYRASKRLETPAPKAANDLLFALGLPTIWQAFIDQVTMPGALANFTALWQQMLMSINSAVITHMGQALLDNAVGGGSRQLFSTWVADAQQALSGAEQDVQVLMLPFEDLEMHIYAALSGLPAPTAYFWRSGERAERINAIGQYFYAKLGVQVCVQIGEFGYRNGFNDDADEMVVDIGSGDSHILGSFNHSSVLPSHMAAEECDCASGCCILHSYAERHQINALPSHLDRGGVRWPTERFAVFRKNFGRSSEVERFFGLLSSPEAGSLGEQLNTMLEYYLPYRGVVYLALPPEVHTKRYGDKDKYNRNITLLRYADGFEAAYTSVEVPICYYHGIEFNDIIREIITPSRGLDHYRDMVMIYGYDKFIDGLCKIADQTFDDEIWMHSYLYSSEKLRIMDLYQVQRLLADCYIEQAEQFDVLAQRVPEHVNWLGVTEAIIEAPVEKSADPDLWRAELACGFIERYQAHFTDASIMAFLDEYDCYKCVDRRRYEWTGDHDCRYPYHYLNYAENITKKFKEVAQKRGIIS